MLLVNSLALLVVTSLVTALPSIQHNAERSVSFDFNYDKVRGVNIGGWLVLEPWITPSIFTSLDQSLGIVDEFTLGQKLGSAAALKVLKPHWDSWCTWADFKKIADAGFNTVRIPIGYWAYALVNGEPYTQGAAPYIDAAVDWARSLGLKIWIDLHGAPGSQNGFDNSGHRILQPGQPGWQQGNTVQQTLDVLKNISQKYAQPQYQDVIVAIELLNEPLSPELNFDKLKQFYRDGFFQTRDISYTPVVIHDAFVAPSQWNNFLSPADTNAQYAIVDHHEYQVFDLNLIKMTPAQHVQYVCSNAPNWCGTDKWEVIGEWSAAMTDCAPFLNGYGKGARYDGSFEGSTFVGSCAGRSNIATWNQQLKNDTRAYLEAQLSIFEAHTNGWIFWNFKTEAAHEWDALKLLDAGVFPNPKGPRVAKVCS